MDDVVLPTSPWRRPLLVACGLALLAVGVWLNPDRFGGPEPPSMTHEEEPQAESNRFVGYLKQADEEIDISEIAGVDDIENSGRRHKGEEGRMGRPANGVAPAIATHRDARSTFSIDVDTASYAVVRRYLVEGEAPPIEMVRTEELVNYFDYDYPQPEEGVPFSVTTEVGPAPWNPKHRLVHVGLQGKMLADGEARARNLVFLVDVSGSMEGEKLELVKAGLAALARRLGTSDRIAIVTYAGEAGTVLLPTSGAEIATIHAALASLTSGGGTNGGEGIERAYELARAYFIADGINRVILATDGDFNVGPSSPEELVALIERERESGVFLSVIGVGREELADAMMEQLADNGNGNYAYVDSEREANKVFVEESGAMLDTIAKDVKVQVEFDPKQVRWHRLVGYENRRLAHADFANDAKDAGEIGAGHSVTALYEIAPTATLDDGAFMELRLRYKDPDGSESRELSFDVRDDGRALADTSDDFRFSAAVAAFAQKLRGANSETKLSYRDLIELASGALGRDEHCYRRELVELLQRAGQRTGERIAIVPACVPVGAIAAASPTHPATVTTPTDDIAAFELEVLRLLPPFLALPLFVLAFRRPRKREDLTRAEPRG